MEYFYINTPALQRNKQNLTTSLHIRDVRLKSQSIVISLFSADNIVCIENLNVYRNVQEDLKSLQACIDKDDLQLLQLPPSTPLRRAASQGTPSSSSALDFRPTKDQSLNLFSLPHQPIGLHRAVSSSNNEIAEDRNSAVIAHYSQIPFDRIGPESFVAILKLPNGLETNEKISIGGNIVGVGPTKKSTLFNVSLQIDHKPSNFIFAALTNKKCSSSVVYGGLLRCVNYIIETLEDSSNNDNNLLMHQHLLNYVNFLPSYLCDVIHECSLKRRVKSDNKFSLIYCSLTPF